MKKPPFINSHIYHVYNRGVEKRNIFMDDHDRFQFIHDLFDFNDENSAIKLREEESSEVQPPKIRRYKNKKSREILVEILAFVLMPNHFHLLLRQEIDNGVPKFMQKLGTGYTMSFNKKYKRVGGLFQGNYKAVLVEKEEHLRYLPIYIHLNPCKIFHKNDGGPTSVASSEFEFLENYRWSSLLDYIGKKNFPSVIEMDFLSEMLGPGKEHKQEIRNWLRKSDDVKDLIDEIF